MRKLPVEFNSGELTLEGMVMVPPVKLPLPGVVVCHPHPLYGGSMDNNVVDAVCEALTAASFIAMKFNFRGVGASRGEYDAGFGEQDDVRAAIAYLAGLEGVDAARIGLAGYSAGAAFSFRVAMDDRRVRAYAAISPAIPRDAFPELEGFTKPKLFVSGSEDEIVPAAQMERMCGYLPEPKECRIIEGADHFWAWSEAAMAEMVAAFFQNVFRRTNPSR